MNKRLNSPFFLFPVFFFFFELEYKCKIFTFIEKYTEIREIIVPKILSLLLNYYKFRKYKRKTLRKEKKWVFVI